MNSRGCMMHTTVSDFLAGTYSVPVVAAPSCVRNTTFRVVVPGGTSRGLQSVPRKPAVGDWSARGARCAETALVMSVSM